MIKTVALMILLAGSAAAQDLPALYNVTGVASDDILNVRTRPMASANVIGTLAYDATGVEVLEEENGWGRVNVDGQPGWANLRFLAEVPGSQITGAAQFNCFGTEPFWSVFVRPEDQVVFSTPQDPDRAYSVGALVTASGRFSPHAILGTAPGQNISVTVSQRACTDGMSDNAFGFEGTVITSGYDTQVYSGCCTLQVD
ncbi:COG3650 family protein [Tropicibacter naphthalenivorans]|uniref:Putative membrane protein n=1 Tax=Tropicibacter naphthalenivorans TaxID=441103 RepID=A0A0P1GD57_9RHOB|nr:SH3 domain-containing protein [Tropicibacter naphthalenivorans]CUH79262.1 putative membrane protein [Tropicibacter naphthalenivorans]SMC70949.1 SH3 domain-containing protein [Tropicibacter naphthalenivorans]